MTVYVVGGPPRFDHQRRGLAKAIATRGVTALLMDPGLGKTAVVIDYAGLLALKSPTGEARVLVVCPLVAVDTWVIQTEKFASPMIHWWAEALGGGIRRKADALAARGGKPYPQRPQRLAKPIMVDSSRPVADPHDLPGPRLIIEVVNIDALARRDPVGSRTVADLMLDAIRRFEPDLVVVDESHRIKSVGGNASRLLGRVAQHVRRRMILTGTVMPHSPMDVFAQWRFLAPEAFSQIPGRPATVGSFRNRFAVLGGWMGKEVIGYRNLDDMQKVMARNAIVTRKADALDLPKTTDVVIPVELSPTEKAAYASMRDQLAVALASGQLATVPNRLAQMMRLRQITSGHLPSDDGVVNTIGTSKADTIRSIVHDTLVGERRVVVFCLFSAEIRMLGTLLAKKGTEVLTISGATGSEDRALIRKRFGSDDPARLVLVAQIRTMSLAVNELVTASHAVFGSMSQLRDDYVQARDRLDRIGQTQPVTFWHALAPGTVDTVILRSHRERTSLEAAMLRHIQGEDSGRGKEQG